MIAYEKAGVKPGDKVRVYSEICEYSFEGTVISLEEAEKNWGDGRFYNESDEFIYVKMDKLFYDKMNSCAKFDGYPPQVVFKIDSCCENPKKKRVDMIYSHFYICENCGKEICS